MGVGIELIIVAVAVTVKISVSAGVTVLLKVYRHAAVDVLVAITARGSRRG